MAKMIAENLKSNAERSNLNALSISGHDDWGIWLEGAQSFRVGEIISKLVKYLSRREERERCAIGARRRSRDKKSDNS